MNRRGFLGGLMATVGALFGGTKSHAGMTSRETATEVMRGLSATLDRIEDYIVHEEWDLSGVLTEKQYAGFVESAMAQPVYDHGTVPYVVVENLDVPEEIGCIKPGMIIKNR